MSAIPEVDSFEVGFADRLYALARKPLLDVHVADHCNLRCRGCVHFAPLARERCLDLGDYETDLKALAAIPGIEGYFHGLYLMGGEPLLHSRIADVMRLTRQMLPDMHVLLVTNGILLRRMGDEFWDALVACGVELLVSPYPLKMDYDALLEMARDRGATACFAGDKTGRGAGKEAFFKLALDPSGTQDPTRAFNACFFGGVNIQLREGSLWNCQIAAHHAALNDAFGWGLEGGPADELPLASIASTNDIEAFRRSAHPMCRYCASNRMRVVAWGRSRRDEREWRIE